MRLTEKYRPQSWDDVVGQEDIISSIKDKIKRKGLDCPHLLLLGPPGVGKSSTAYIVWKELEKMHGKDSLVGIQILEHNASDFRGIDFIRDKIKKSVKFKVFKIIFLDEADNLTNEAQQSLRRIMEKAMTTLFILSGNDPDGFIDAIKSRCAVYTFKPIPNKAVKESLLHIIDSEGYVLEEDASIHAALDVLVAQSNGDMRTAINNLEKVIDGEGRITVKSTALFKPKVHESKFSEFQGTSIQGLYEKMEKLKEGTGDDREGE